MSEKKKIEFTSTEEKYPVKNTICPTPFDNEISKTTEWLKENRPNAWEIAQTAPSEISFKLYLFSYIHADYGDELQDFTDGKTDIPPSSFTEQVKLYDHPNLSLADLEWDLERAKAANSPFVVNLKKIIAKFKEEHGITD